MMIAVGSFAARTQAPHLAFLEPSVDRVSHTAWRWHRRRYGCDRSVRRVGNVATAFPLLEDPRQTAIKAVVIYCGTASIETFRRDLPVLYVRAGLDRPNVNEEILTPASRANSQKADVTVLNHATGYHGFELFNDDDATHDVIARTLMFLIHATRLGSRAALVRRFARSRRRWQHADGRVSRRRVTLR